LDSINWLKQIPKRNNDRVFLIDQITGKEIKFDELHKHAAIVGINLTSLGFKKGDRIAIIANDSLSLAKLYFGCLYSGIAIVPINPISTKDEIEYIIKNSNVKKIIISLEIKNKIKLNYLKKNTFLLDSKNNILITSDNNKISLNEYNQKAENSFYPFKGVSSKDELIIVYTSGTTARPKAVVHSISNVVENAKLFGKKIGINAKNRFYNLLSLTYLGGYYNLLLLPYICESSVVLGNVFDAKIAMSFWNPIIRYKVNTLWLVPSIMSVLLEIDRGMDGWKYCRKNINYVLCGTAPLPNKLRLDFEKKYGVKVYENYGLSETLFISTNAPKEDTKSNNVGKILPTVKVKIVNNQQKVAKGNEGEILVNTPSIMCGYISNKGKIDSIQRNKWFETGDIGKISNENELIVTGRKKDLIIRGGINISPASIENVIYQNPSVKECAVVGIPHKFQGEEIVAVISLVSSVTFDKIESVLINLCKKNLSTIKQPNRFVELPELPHTTYGKIQKNKIRAWLLHTKESFLEKEKINIKKFKTKKIDFQPSTTVSNSIEALSIKYNTMVYEKQRRGEDVIVLSLGEAFFNIPLFSFDKLPKEKIYHYSHSRGIPELREKISNYFHENYDVVFDYEKEILITAGSKIGIHMSLMTILNPGDEVIIHEPAWVSFPEQIKLCHAKPIAVPYYKAVFDFEKYVSKKTKMIIINSPNNPSGKIYTLEELSFLYKLAKKHKLFILSDEAYSDFVLDDDEFISFANLDTEKKHSIVVNSISKNFGISGWRVGYVISNHKIINQLLKVNQHLVTCPPTILEYYISKYFEEIIHITKPQILKLVKLINRQTHLLE